MFDQPKDSIPNLWKSDAVLYPLSYSGLVIYRVFCCTWQANVSSTTLQYGKTSYLMMFHHTLRPYLMALEYAIKAIFDGLSGVRCGIICHLKVGDERLDSPPCCHPMSAGGV